MKDVRTLINGIDNHSAKGLIRECATQFLKGGMDARCIVRHTYVFGHDKCVDLLCLMMLICYKDCVIPFVFLAKKRKKRLIAVFFFNPQKRNKGYAEENGQKNSFESNMLNLLFTFLKSKLCIIDIHIFTYPIFLFYFAYGNSLFLLGIH